MKFIKLPNRLQAVADPVAEGASVADIGTDHGLVPVYLAQTGRARRIIASDKSSGSLRAAQRNAAKYNVSGLIEFAVAPGLDHIGQDDADTIIIAGVGGETILGILADAPWTAEACNEGRLCLLLQPQSKLDVLRYFLHNNGYNIKSETAVTDRGRRYIVLEVKGQRNDYA